MNSSIKLLNNFVYRHRSCTTTFNSRKIMNLYTRKCVLFHSKCSSFFYMLKLRKHVIGESSQWTYSRSVNFYSTLRHSNLTAGINIEAFKEQCRRHLLMTGNEIRPDDLVKEELKVRYDLAIANMSAKEKRTLKIIQLEHSFLFSQGYAIPPPEEMTNENWLQAVTLGTMEERFDFYIGIEDIKIQRASSEDTSSKETAPSERVYDNPNSIFYDYENPDLEVRWGNYRLASAMQFGSPLVIDMDFVEMNSASDLISITQQLWDMYCVNLAHHEPFHLIFTNCSESNPIYRHLILHHMIKAPFVLATFTWKSHVDLFPLPDMIYLSAVAHDTLGAFNPGVVYIVGAYHDPLVRKKGSYVRAKEYQIKSQRFPIQENVRWKRQSSKDLDMNQMIAVFLSVKSKMSWKDALISNVPMLVNQD